MRKIILTIAERKALLKEIEEELKSKRTNGTFTVSYKAKEQDLDEPIVLNFTSIAWFKTFTLVNEFTTECAWHGLVHESENRKTFTVYDIIVYPQTVTGATVDMDEKEYEVWHQSLDDRSYNNLRMQAHSHVNMAATPSGKDKTTYEDIQHTLSNDSFYIFMIFNKKGDVWVNIYDLKNNAVYDKSDIVITVDGFPVEKWVQADWFSTQKDLVKTPKVKRPTIKNIKETSYHDYITERDTFDSAFFAAEGRSF